MSEKTTYWQENLRLIFICLSIWFVVSFGFGLLLVDLLNEVRLGGYKLGFWFAQARFHFILLLCLFFGIAKK